MTEITLTLTRDEATALLHSYDINEFPVSNSLGRDGERILREAEEKLQAALGLPTDGESATE